MHAILHIIDSFIAGRPGSIPRDSAGSSIGQYHTGQGALKEVGGISRSPGVATGE